MSTLSPQLVTACPACGKELAAGALACGECHALVHGRALDSLAADANRLEGEGEPQAAAEQWWRMLTLLPPESKQAIWVREKVEALNATAAPPEKPKHEWARKLGPLAPLLIFLGKAKGLLLAVFKLKFLFGFFSFLALYWAMFGWRFGAGLAVAILIHELGHYIDVRRRGWPAEMPVFLPGLGAYVRWKAMGVTLSQRAEVSMAGPLAGWIAAAACWFAYQRTGDPIWSALGRTGAVLNVLNLIPVWVLDGGQATDALARPERVALLAVSILLGLVTGEKIYYFVAAGAVWRLVAKNGTRNLPEQSSWGVLTYYAAVLGALGLVLKALPTTEWHR